MRLPLRGRLLAGQSIRRIRRADVVMIKHPKAGSTWLRVMIFRLYQRKFGLPPRRVAKTDEMVRRHPSLPRFALTSAHYGFEAGTRQWMESDEGFEVMAGRKALFLVRHPCDLAVSWYHKLTNRIFGFRRELILASLEHPVRLEEISLEELVRHPELGVPGIIDYLNWSVALASRLPDALLVRYEDLRADTAGKLREVVDFLGGSFSDAEVAEAVEFASFDNLKELERSSYFANSGLSMHRSGKANAFKVRRGRVGGYRSELPEHVYEELDALVESRLDPALGYSGRSAAAPTASPDERARVPAGSLS